MTSFQPTPLLFIENQLNERLYRTSLTVLPVVEQRQHSPDLVLPLIRLAIE